MNTTKQRGAVSIFIVVFTALLVTIVTTGFVQIMVQGQRQAMNNDLSQSAYDSALAGVEDAKRALVRLKECQRESGSTVDCSKLRSALTDQGQDCDVLGLDKAGVATFDNGEVQVRGLQEVNQAYTCVTVQIATDSVEGSFLDQDQVVVIPLDSVGNDEDIKAVRISWFMRKDMPDGATPTFATPLELPSIGEENWPTTTPPIIRSQLIQFSKGNINLNDFSSDSARTLFLYPTPVANADTVAAGGFNLDFGSDARRDSDGSRNLPSAASCAQNHDVVTYLCSVTIDLPEQANREAYLQLAALYNKTQYAVELIGDTNGVLDFDGVQPRVDSTGRASDLFRRVEARVSVRDTGSISGLFPKAALILNKNLCKDFFVTDRADEYGSDTDAIECEPSSDTIDAPGAEED